MNYDIKMESLVKTSRNGGYRKLMNQTLEFASMGAQDHTYRKAESTGFSEQLQSQASCLSYWSLIHTC